LREVFQMKKPPIVNFNGIKLSPKFFDAVSLEPEVSIGFDPSVPYLPAYPWLFDAEGAVAPLHDCVWAFFHKNDRPKKEGEIVHHIDGDPLNATIENLGVGSRSVHALAHTMKRQRFTPRKRWRLFGFFRPHAEEPVRALPADEDHAYRAQLLARERARDERDQLRRGGSTRSRPRASGSRLDAVRRSRPRRLPPATPPSPRTSSWSGRCRSSARSSTTSTAARRSRRRRAGRGRRTASSASGASGGAARRPRRPWCASS
jgi:hypothetical protein